MQAFPVPDSRGLGPAMTKNRNRKAINNSYRYKREIRPLIVLEQCAISQRWPGVMPAQAGIQQDIDRTMDSRLRGNDNTADCVSI